MYINYIPISTTILFLHAGLFLYNIYLYIILLFQIAILFLHAGLFLYKIYLYKCPAVRAPFVILYVYSFLYCACSGKTFVNLPLSYTFNFVNLSHFVYYGQFSRHVVVTNMKILPTGSRIL